MKKIIILVLAITGIIGIGMQSKLAAKVETVNVGHGTYVRGDKHWVKKEPKDKPLNLELIPIGQTKFKIGEMPQIGVKLENASLHEQQIDYIYVHLEIYDKDFKNIIASTNMNSSGSINLKKGHFEIKKCPLEIVKKINQAGDYIVWAYYSLPDDKGINSNDLKIRIEP